MTRPLSPLSYPPSFIDAFTWLRSKAPAHHDEADYLLGKLEAFLDDISIPQVRQETIDILWQTLLATRYLTNHPAPSLPDIGQVQNLVHSLLHQSNKYYSERINGVARSVPPTKS